MTHHDKDPEGLYAYFEKDRKRPTREFFGRETGADRRGFLKGAGLATMGAYGRRRHPVPSQHAGRFHPGSARQR